VAPLFLRAAASALLVLASCGVAAGKAQVVEDHSGLTRETFREKCLLCHHSAAPEGISPEIMAGLHPVPGLKPADAMPNIRCWRRCKDCWGPSHAAASPPPTK
jgi:hypothetical protein